MRKLCFNSGQDGLFTTLTHRCYFTCFNHAELHTRFTEQVLFHKPWRDVIYKLKNEHPVARRPHRLQILFRQFEQNNLFDSLNNVNKKINTLEMEIKDSLNHAGLYRKPVIFMKGSEFLYILRILCSSSFVVASLSSKDYIDEDCRSKINRFVSLLCRK